MLVAGVSCSALSATESQIENATAACDYLAASPADPDRQSDGVALDRIDGEAAIGACKAALQEEPTNARFAYQLARAYESEKRSPDALEWYRTAAQMNYAIAKHDLAMLMLILGESAADHWKAIEWMKSAALQGLPLAQRNLGSIHFRGTKFLKPYPAEAREWLQSAVDSGREDAEFELATMYDRGLGGDVDGARAAALYEQAASRGNRIAQVRLARLYLWGVGVPRDPERGWSILVRMLNQTGGEAERVMALCYLAGQYVAEDRERGYEYLLAAADAGSRSAEKHLLTMYSMYSLLFNSPGFDLPGPHGVAEAIAWMESRANEGSWLAAENLSHIYEEGRGVPADRAVAAKWKARSRELKPLR